MHRQPIINRFKDRVAVVTGGASGIGRAIVEELCKEGAAVCFLDLDEDQGHSLAAALGGAHADVLFHQGDVSDERVCYAAVEEMGQD
jgi:NAD(P)-dependent dehydrogenase (short-subunit alcohol dehydrogenase family)